jgi:hypothetical protein
MNSNLCLTGYTPHLTQVYLLIQHTGLLPEIAYYIMNTFIDVEITGIINSFFKTMNYTLHINSLKEVREHMQTEILNENIKIHINIRRLYIGRTRVKAVNDNEEVGQNIRDR